MKLFRFGSLLALLVLVGTLVPVGLAANNARQAQAPNAIVDIQFLSVSDWHGQVDTSNANVSGGAAEISTIWKKYRAQNPNTITLTAGDDFGASQPLAAYFNEEPAVIAQRMMGIQVNTFGNHNFDRGVTHLQQMIDLAGSPTQLLTPTSAYTNGLPYSYVAANLANTTGVLTGVAPYKIIEMSGVKVAIIGLVNEEAASLLKPGSMGPIVVTDSAEAAMDARDAAAAEGAQVFVAITHKGIDSKVNNVGSGLLVDFAQDVTGFDVIFGDHIDLEYNAVINGARVVQNRSKGVTHAVVNLSFDTSTNDVVAVPSASIYPTTFVANQMLGAVADPAILTMLKPYRTGLAQVYDVPIAVSNGYFPRSMASERLGEAAIGNLVADTMREHYGTQIAVLNGGGQRDTVPSVYGPANLNLRRSGGNYKLGPQFDIVVGDIYALLPFGNSSVVRTVTGGQLWRMMENGVSAYPGTFGKFPQISGFKFAFDGSRPVNSRVISITLDDGTAVMSDTTSYSLFTNDFLNLGGDDYNALKEGQPGATLEVMADVLRDIVRETGVITPVKTGRILNATRIGGPFADQVIARDSQTPVIPFTIVDPTSTTTATLKATSGNAALVPVSNVVFGGSGANRTVQVTPLPGKTGIATILIEVAGKSKGYETLVVIVNGPPSITSNASVTSPEDTPATVDVGVRDLDTRAQDLVITATPGNGILIPAQNLVFSGTGITRTLTITPAADLVGSTTVTIAASDGVSTITKTLDVTFTAVNDAPTISAIADQTLIVGQSTGALTFSVADLDNAAGSLVVTATSSNTTLVPNANIAIGGSGANRTLTVTPAANQTGTTTITLTVTDGDKSSIETFTVTVAAEPEYDLFLPLVLR